MTVYKVFCDESCHLEHDGADVMVLGAIHCAADKTTALNKHIKWLRHRHSYSPELKWNKLHKHQWPLYQDLIDMILDDTDVNFKATVVDKTKLDHQKYNAGSHSNFYYKMFYYTLRDFLSRGNEYRIYLDYMDTLGAEKTRKLCEVLQTGTYWQLSVNATIVHSYEVQLIQLCDLLIGAVAYRNRSDIERKSPIKRKFMEYIEQKIGRRLDIQTSRAEKSFNIFHPELQEG